MTILSFVALFAGLGLASTGGNFMSATSLVLGIFIGSSSWLLILCSGVDLFREKLSPPRMQWINRISGAIIAGFGLVALLG
jgi:threonine/homoserine/homoserine lactone efflux protein